MYDFHCHFVPDVASEGEPEVVYERGVPSYTFRSQLADVDRLLRTLDEGGVEVAILSNLRGLSGNEEDVRRANEALAKVVEQHSDRLMFLPSITVPMTDIALDDIAGWLERAPGVSAASRYDAANLDSPELDGLYDTLASRERFLWVHPAMGPSEEEARTFDQFDLYRTVGREYSMSTAVLRLVLGGVFDRHKRLKVVVAHLGGGIASLLPRIKLFQNKAFFNLMADPQHGRTSARPVEEYLAESLYFDTGGVLGDIGAVEATAQVIPPERIVLGTDYPQEITEASRVRGLCNWFAERGLTDTHAELLGTFGNRGR